MITRRQFLAGAVSAGGIVLASAELLVPRRTYFLPPAGGWIGRHVFYRNFMSDGIIEQAEWFGSVPGPDLKDLYAYATGPHEGPLRLDIFV